MPTGQNPLQVKQSTILYSLISLDLHGATEWQRQLFYETLQSQRWTRIDNLTTSFEVVFAAGTGQPQALAAITRALDFAKSASKVSRVEFACQISIEKVIAGKR